MGEWVDLRMSRDNISKDKALKKLKEAKEHLELEIITQEEYDKLKVELKPIIMDSSINQNEVSSKKDDNKPLESNENWEQVDYNFEEWFSFVEPLNELIKEGEPKIKTFLKQFVVEKLQDAALN